MKSKLKAIRGLLMFFMVALFLSGLTAIPIETELRFLSRFFPAGNTVGDFLDRLLVGVAEMNTKHPFLGYGYDWLAFAHFVLAMLFIGPYHNPVKNKWVIEFGMIACLLIVPFAFIAGHFREIPIWWRLIDCSFGVFGIIPLYICYRMIKKMETNSNEKKYHSAIMKSETQFLPDYQL